MQPLVAYGLDEDAIDMGAKLAKKTLEMKENVSNISLSLIPFKNAFQKFLRLVKISMTIAVSVNGPITCAGLGDRSACPTL